MGLFKSERYQVTIAPEVLQISQFKKIVDRDKTTEKRLAGLELSYVFFIADYTSPYQNFASEDRSDKIKNDLKLPVNWKPDLVVSEAIAKYEELSTTPTVKMLASVRESMLTSSKVINQLRGYIEETLASVEMPEDEEEKANKAEDISAIISSVSSLIQLSAKLPALIATLDNLEDKVKKEQSVEKKIKGGGAPNVFEE